MQGQTVRHSVHLHGTLAADAKGYIYLPKGGTLLAVSATASNAASSTLKLGTVADDDAIFTAAAIGQSGTPVVWDQGDWNGAGNTLGSDENYYVAPATTLLWTLDFDGASGTAGQNVSLTFDWLE
jgi:hypothetical protein